MTRILVKAPNWVGDCIMMTPALTLLRQACPDAQVDVLARPGIAGVLHGNPDLNAVIAMDERKPDADVRRALVSAGYDAISLMPNSLGSAWFAARLRIPVRVGFRRGGRGVLLSHAIPFRPAEWQTRTPAPLSKKSLPGKREESVPRHMVFYYLQVAQATLEALGVRAGMPADPRLRLSVADDAAVRVADLLAPLGARSLIGINPGAAYGGAKRWPLEYLAQVMERLAVSPETAIVSTASAKESALNDEVQRHTGVPIHRLGEQLDLQGLAALLARLDVLITNDSGAMHMAAALATPTVAVFGPTDWEVTRPWSPAAVVLRESPECAPCLLRECPVDHCCMRLLTPDTVVAAARGLLERSASVGR